MGPPRSRPKGDAAVSGKLFIAGLVCGLCLGLGIRKPEGESGPKSHEECLSWAFADLADRESMRPKSLFWLREAENRFMRQVTFCHSEFGYAPDPVMDAIEEKAALAWELDALQALDVFEERPEGASR